MTRQEFTDLTMDLFEEYFPKVNKTDRKAFIKSQLAELEELGFELEDDTSDDEDDDVEELDF